MKLRRWDIVFVAIDDKDAVGHPAVVLSHEARLDDVRVQRINVLVGTKKQPAEASREHHALLNEADGLDFLTAVDCSFVYTVQKVRIKRVAGTVSYARRADIQRKVRAFLGLG